MSPLRTFSLFPTGFIVGDVAIDPGRASAPRVAVAAHIAFDLSHSLGPYIVVTFVAHSRPHTIAVYVSCSRSPTPTQRSLPGGPLRPYLGGTFTGWTAPAWPGAREI
jgi:hypothetical protein